MKKRWCILMLLLLFSYEVMSDSLQPQTVAHQACLSMDFSRQEYGRGLPWSPPRHLPNPGTKPVSLACVTCIAGRFYPLSHQGSLHFGNGTPHPGWIQRALLQTWDFVQNWDLGSIWKNCHFPLYFFHFKWNCKLYNNNQFSSVTQSCPTLCDLMDGCKPAFPIHHQLPELAQTHVHWVGDAIQPSHPLSSPSPPSFNPSQHQGLFKWVSSSHQVARVLEFQLQYQFFQWTPRTDLH